MLRLEHFRAHGTAAVHGRQVLFERAPVRRDTSACAENQWLEETRARGVIGFYHGLFANDAQELLNFLRSL